MEEKTKDHDHSFFWLGLIIGAVVTGVLVYLLDRDGKGNLVGNLKKDLQVILAKVNKLVNEKGTPELSVEEVKSEMENGGLVALKVAEPKPKKFFKKNGKLLS